MSSSEPGKLAGKVALVTGTSAGFGRAAALALAQGGADVALNYPTLPEAGEEPGAQIRELHQPRIGAHKLRVVALTEKEGVTEALTAVSIFGRQGSGSSC